MLAALLTLGIVLPSSPAAAEAVVTPKPLALPTFDGEVMAMVVRGSTLYVGGSFTHALVGRTVIERSRLAAIDVTTGELLSWQPSANASVTALAANDSAIYIAGMFTAIGGTTRDSLAAVDPISGDIKDLTHRIDGDPRALALTANRLYLGGTLTSVDDTPVAGAAAFDLATGDFDSDWLPKPSRSTVNAIVVGSRGVYLGGRFANVGGVIGTRHIALVSPTSGAPRTDFVSGLAYEVISLTLVGNRIYAGIAGPGGRLMSLDSTTGVAQWTVTTDGDVDAVALLDNVIYFGGHFDHVCRTSNVGVHGVCLDGHEIRVKIAAVTLNGMLLNWSANANGVRGVRTLISHPGLGIVAAGGAFTEINGHTYKRLVVFRRNPANVVNTVVTNGVRITSRPSTR